MNVTNTAYGLPANPCNMKITTIKRQVKWPNRYSIYIDGVFAFGLSESGLLQAGIATGQEIDSRQRKALQEMAAGDKAYGSALRYVTMRPRSEWELRTYLQRKTIDALSIQVIVERLAAIGLLDDTAFARSWVANRRLLKPTSIRKLRLELKQKHVAAHIIDQTLHDDETNERDVIRVLIAKKQARYPDQVKLMQYLARQGFSYDDIKTSLSNQEDD